MKHGTPANSCHDHGAPAMEPGRRRPSTLSGGGLQYTCPMHPEVISDKPGICPKCGMTLAPRTGGADEHERHEIRSLSLKFWIGLALTMPVLTLAMGKHV